MTYLHRKWATTSSEENSTVCNHTNKGLVDLRIKIIGVIHVIILLSFKWENRLPRI